MCLCKSVWVCVQPYIRGIPLTVLFWVFSMAGETTNQHEIACDFKARNGSWEYLKMEAAKFPSYILLS